MSDSHAHERVEIHLRTGCPLEVNITRFFLRISPWVCPGAVTAIKYHSSGLPFLTGDTKS